MRAVVCLALASLALHAQPAAQISGQVRDPSGAVVTGARITVMHAGSGLRRTAESGLDGSYAVSSLPEGEYKITARKTGFRTVAQLGVQLESRDAARLDFDLQIGGMQEFITIEGGNSSINIEDASAGVRVDDETARRLPVNGRTPQGLISLAPGVLSTPATLGEAGQFSVNGQRPNANYFVTDGVSSNSGVGSAGLPGQFSGGTLPAMTAIGSLQGLAVIGEVREMQVKTSTFAPEFGRMPGAQVLVTTSSGSNGLHGEISHAFRHERLSSRDYFAETKAPLRLNDLNLGLGGPIQKDKTFFFAAGEVLRMRQPSAWKAPSVPSDAPPNPLLDAFPHQSNLQTSWPASVSSGSVRIDRSLASTGALFLRYHDTASDNRVGLVQQSQSSFGTRSFTVGVTHSPAPSMVNDIRFNFTRTSVESTWTPGLATTGTLRAVQSLFDMPRGLYGLSIGGLGQIVWSHPSTSKQGQFQLVDTFAVTAGRHQLRLGFDYLRLTPSRPETITAALAQYESVADLLAQRPPLKNYVDAPGGSSLIEIISGFAQDTWSVNPRLNLTYGLRWEYMPPPASRVISPNNNVPTWNSRFGRAAPRVGLAYRLNREGTFVFRAGAGIFYDLGFASAIDPLNSVPFNSWRLSTSLPSFNEGAAPLFGFATDLRIPYSWQWNVTLEGNAPGGGIMSAAWVGSMGRGLLRREGHVAAGTVLATSNGESSYHAFQAHYRKKVVAGLSGIASYTWSHAIDNGSWDSGAYLVGDGIDARRDRGPSNFDVRHSFSAGFNYDLPAKGWSLHGIARLRTGFPIDVLTRENAFGLGFDNAPRPDLVPGVPVWINGRINPAAFATPAPGHLGTLGRNALRGGGMGQLDAAVERRFTLPHASSLRVRLQAYNVTNTRSLADPVRVLNSPLFGQPASLMSLMFGTGRPTSGISPAFQSGGPRTMEVSLSWIF
jgi:hypothetical protein